MSNIKRTTRKSTGGDAPRRPLRLEKRLTFPVASREFEHAKIAQGQENADEDTSTSTKQTSQAQAVRNIVLKWGNLLQDMYQQVNDNYNDSEDESWTDNRSSDRETTKELAGRMCKLEQMKAAKQPKILQNVSLGMIQQDWALIRVHKLPVP
ncbi:hypothetical protein LTR56_025391 [Elasticomyces elasticus]|nr:hypothetical protein LTR22_028397 [Elasticomyces elasticus]KAK3617290.1 hypothetical protein LTR56_025391 [Elasticomyces elasticus]KAK4904920.1 hypothetical protein LTR49_025714 [Elasticomyces elasticus]KAK5742399.1 hypothetical protein LTS12_024262 [Elasticomyces elasticus]